MFYVWLSDNSLCGVLAFLECLLPPKFTTPSVWLNRFYKTTPQRKQLFVILSTVDILGLLHTVPLDEGLSLPVHPGLVCAKGASVFLRVMAPRTVKILE